MQCLQKNNKFNKKIEKNLFSKHHKLLLIRGANIVEISTRVVAYPRI